MANMDKEIEKILKTIDVGEKGTFLFELRQQTLKATTGDAQQIIKRIIDIRGQHFVGTDCSFIRRIHYGTKL
jgi:hypothetical protein